MLPVSMSGAFAWVSDEADPPARWDLRLLGWRMTIPNSAPPTAGETVWLFDCRPRSIARRWQDMNPAKLIAAVGVDGQEERVAMLAAGFGEVLSTRVALSELALRLTRLAEQVDVMPRFRRAGPALLDLFHRDARIGGRWLSLHPREFALFWRLAETPDIPVDRGELLSDVWRLEHVPETNSLEVHVSRLRAKLGMAHAAWLIETVPQGGYRLGQRSSKSFFAFQTRHHALDSTQPNAHDACDDAGNVSGNHGE